MAAANGLALSITATTYATNPDLALTFDAAHLELSLATVSTLAFSFDGATDHGRMDSTVVKFLQRDLRFNKIWFRVAAGANPATGFVGVWA